MDKKDIKVRVGDKVIKLREERQLLARFMIIQLKRKLDLRSAIGEFKIAVIPRSFFNNDGTLLTCKTCYKYSTRSYELPCARKYVACVN